MAEVLQDASAPSVRLVDSSATKAHLEAQDTVWPSNDPALADVQAKARGRAAEVNQKYPATSPGLTRDPFAPEEYGASASVRAPSDIAELRAPTARIVTDEHVPVVAKNEILAQAIQTAINNSDELQKLGIDPSTIRTPGDAEVMLQKAADHIRTNLDPRASSTITFDAQKQLAEELGMSVED